MNTKHEFSTLLQNYFCQYLIDQKRVSDRTVQSYRDTFCLLLKFSEKNNINSPSKLCLSDINADFIVKFLSYLELERNNSITTRNIRLAAIRSFFRYAEFHEPESLPEIQRVLSIPMKRHDHKLIGSLTKEEINAILDSVDKDTWSGRRDHALLTTLYNTGARVSEIISIKICDVRMSDHFVILLHGKGRKERSVPLWKSTSALLKKWLKEINTDPKTPLFPNHFGEMMTRSGVEDRLKVAVHNAIPVCNSLSHKKISPHVIRHTTAMHLLQSGVDLTVIALWLGHENINTTHKYMEADLQMKEKTLKALSDPNQKAKKRTLPDSLLKFLESL